MCLLRIHAPAIAKEILRGESVAVAGACLTVVAAGRDFFDAQMMLETMRATRLGALKPGDFVNLERALRIGDRLDGHMVSGHVDGVGVVSSVEDFGETRTLWVSVTGNISWGIAGKGSVAVDGVSLTVINSTKEAFSVGLIPTTLGDTTIASLVSGDLVNVEIDIVARYIARLAECGAPAGKSAITWGKLQEYGWL